MDTTTRMDGQAVEAVRHVPTVTLEHRVTRMALQGRSKAEAADALGVDEATLERYYGHCFRPGRLPARPNEHVPTAAVRTMVRRMAAYGIPVPDIAKMVGIGLQALYVHYGDEMRDGRIEVHGEIAEKIVTAAKMSIRRIRAEDGTEYDVIDKEGLKAAFFYAKTQMGWSETTKIHTGQDPNAAPMQVEASSAKARLIEVLAGVAVEVDKEEDLQEDSSPPLLEGRATVLDRVPSTADESSADESRAGDADGRTKGDESDEDDDSGDLF